jgi:hypothetical protein
MLFITNIVGTIGVFFCLLGYFLLQCEKIDARSLSFSLYNLFGSLMILFSLLYDWNLPAVLIEAAWAVISLLGLARFLIRRYKERTSA